MLHSVLCAFIFKHKTNCSSGDAFVSGGFRNWHLKKED